MRRPAAALLVIVGLVLGSGWASAASDPLVLACEIFKELIEINTTHSAGDTTRAAEAMARRLRDGGFSTQDIQVLAAVPRKGNLVARLRGSGQRPPLLLLAHLDVVEAKPEDWTVDPFKFLEKDGFFYGRGTSDDKAMAAIWITNLIRYKQEGFRPERDLIVALTADEESGDDNGVKWLIEKHRELIDAEYCINEGGDGEIKKGRYLLNEVKASEKTYQSFRLEAHNRGGHSSRPTKENAIYALAEALTRISQLEFPVLVNEVTRAFFERMSTIETGPLAADMRAVAQPIPDIAAADRLAQSAYYNALMRTTCVATLLEGGHAENALPQLARAVVNCRLLPGESVDTVRRTLVSTVANGEIQVTPVKEATVGPVSPLRPDVMRAIEGVTAAMWPGVPVVPVMSTGGTDGRFLRTAGIPTYGVSGIFEDIDDRRAHGQDERIRVKSFEEGVEFGYRLVKALSSGS